MRRPLALLAALSLAACGRETTEAPKPQAAAAEETRTPVEVPDDVLPQPPTEAPEPAPEEPVPPTEGGNGAPQSTGAEAEPPRALADGPHVSFAGTGGRAHWVGEAPAPKQLAFNPQTAEPCQHEGAMDTLDRSLLVDAGGGIANVVIEVEVADREVAAAPAPFEMDQRGCSFTPHVLLVPAGATVLYGNSDPFTHNVNVVAKRNDAMNVMVDSGGQRSAEYPKGDQIQIKCDIHPWMSAWVFVSDAPAHALSAADGSFALPALPPGSHKVTCWHESQGKASGMLKVGEDGSIAALDLALSRRR